MPQSPPEQSQPTPSASPSEYRKSTFREYVSRRRWMLGAFALLVIVIIIIALLFVAHVTYRRLGGQGFLGNKRQEADDTRLYLPLRQVQVLEEHQSLWRLIDRSPKNVPYYTCGDQRNSCEFFDQPNICCPVTMACYRATFTPSGIFCCNSTDEGECQPSHIHPPECIKGTVQCSAETGGGCCPSTSECSPNGCIHVLAPYTVSASTTVASPSPESDGPASTTPHSVIITGAPMTVTSTVTERPAATQTLAKSGEVAPSLGAGAGGPIVMKLFVPYSTAGLLLVGVGALMGLL